MSKLGNFFSGRKWLKILLIGALILVTCGGLFGGIVALSRNTDKIDHAMTYKSVGTTKYSIGGLDSKGNYMSTDKSIFTKKAFECQGLNVTPNFDTDVSYQIYFYDQDNKFVHTTGSLTGAFVQDSVPFFAKYARIVITPKDDNKVTIFEVTKYAKQIKTTIYREQGFKNYTEDLFEVEFTDSALSSTDGSVVSSEGLVVCKYINVVPYRESMIFRNLSSVGDLKLFAYDSAKNYVGYSVIKDIATCFTSSEGVLYYSVPLKSLDNSVAFVRFSCGNPSDVMQVYCR